MSKEPTPRMDPAWIRGMTQRRMSRRDLFRYAGAGAGALGLSSILAACGVRSCRRYETTTWVPPERPRTVAKRPAAHSKSRTS